MALNPHKIGNDDDSDGGGDADNDRDDNNGAWPDGFSGVVEFESPTGHLAVVAAVFHVDCCDDLKSPERALASTDIDSVDTFTAVAYLQSACKR